MNKILLIDDDLDDQLFFKEVIESIDPALCCDTATNGKIGLEKLKVNESLPDIIFLDINMPVMNGVDFLIQIKKEKALSEIPVCILTTSNMLRDEKLTKELGAKCFLTKPSDLKMLRKLLQKILLGDFSTNSFTSIV